MRRTRVPKGLMEEAEGAEFVLDDDCLEHIVACTSCGSTLFALARVSPTLQRLVLARLEAINVLVPVLWIYSHRALLKDPMPCRPDQGVHRASRHWRKE